MRRKRIAVITIVVCDFHKGTYSDSSTGIHQLMDPVVIFAEMPNDMNGSVTPMAQFKDDQHVLVRSLANNTTNSLQAVYTVEIRVKGGRDNKSMWSNISTT